jgi:hypothetical protein
MKLPLEVCKQFGLFAYQDEQKGVEAIAAIEDFLEEYQDANELGQKDVIIERDQAGVVTVAKSVKFLPNIFFNLKDLIKDSQKGLKEATNFTTIAIGGALNSEWFMKVGAALYFIYFARDLKSLTLKAEHAGVLVALHHLSAGELNLDIALSELQSRMLNNYHLSLTGDQLDEILDDLIDLHCVKRQGDVISLTEKVVLKDD